jgi:hypothetical protein
VPNCQTFVKWSITNTTTSETQFRATSTTLNGLWWTNVIASVELRFWPYPSRWCGHGRAPRTSIGNASLRWKALGARNIDPRTHSWRGLFTIIRDGAQPALKISPHCCRPSLLCPQQLVMSKFLRVLMRTLPSSLRNRLLRSPPPPSHGLKSGSCSFSSSQNHLLPRSFTPLRQRSVTFCIVVSFPSHPFSTVRS